MVDEAPPLGRGQAQASCWPPGLSWGRPPGRGLGGRGPGRGSLRSLARCPLRRSLARRPRSALPPGRSRDAAGAAKARRRLGLGRASHWPAPRVTRPAPPRPRPDHAPDTPPPLQPPAPRGAQSPGTAGAARSQIWRQIRPPAVHPLPPRPRGSASQARSPGLLVYGARFSGLLQSEAISSGCVGAQLREREIERERERERALWEVSGQREREWKLHPGQQ
ncbi:formin-like protein 16 [Marmota marmota marmota]|uniref:formin-like protein 16 n=1 Tax=Marmota marmota marmota TaxID=9994 RepID=UPI002092CFE7|nr:formin-like protein 16 [Marmota marmota marmota]